MRTEENDPTLRRRMDRLRAGWTPAEIARNEEALAKYAEADRLSKLRAMSDLEVLTKALSAGVQCGGEFYLQEADALQVLRDAGFTREPPMQSITFVFPEGHSIEIFGTSEDLGCVRNHLCDAIPGTKYSKGA